MAVNSLPKWFIMNTVHYAENHVFLTAVTTIGYFVSFKSKLPFPSDVLGCPDPE